MIGPFSGFVLFAMVWAIVFMIGLQIGQDTQGDHGERVPGTHLSSPMQFRLGRRVLWATVIALLIWAPIVWFIASGIVTIETLNRLTGFESIR